MLSATPRTTTTTATTPRTMTTTAAATTSTTAGPTTAAAIGHTTTSSINTITNRTNVQAPKRNGPPPTTPTRGTGRKTPILSTKSINGKDTRHQDPPLSPRSTALHAQVIFILLFYTL